MEKKKLDSQTIDKINNSPIVLRSKSNFKGKNWKKKYNKLDKKYIDAVKELDVIKAHIYDLIEASNREVGKYNGIIKQGDKQDITSSGEPIKFDAQILTDAYTMAFISDRFITDDGSVFEDKIKQEVRQEEGSKLSNDIHAIHERNRKKVQSREDKIEALEILSEAKDEEIERLNKEINNLKNTLNDAPPNYLESKHCKNIIQDRDRRILELEFELKERDSRIESLFSENAKISKHLEKSGVKGTFLTVEQQLELIEKGLPSKTKHITNLVSQIGKIKSEYDIRINARDEIIARLKEQINQLQNKTK